MVIARIVTGVALLAALAACGGKDANPGVTGKGDGKSNDSTERSYVVTGVTEKGEPKDLVKDTEIRLHFSGGRLTVTAGCNTMSGSYTLDGTRLTVQPMSMTEMGCDQARMDQDDWLAGLFEKPVQFTDGGDGVVISGTTVLAIADRETVSPDKPLVGTFWQLDSIGTGDSVSSVPEGVIAWIRIGPNGVVRYFNGCQYGTARIEVDGSTLKHRPGGAVNLNACLDDPRNEVSAAMRLVLDSDAGFAIEESTLTVTHGGRSLGFRAVDSEPKPR